MDWERPGIGQMALYLFIESVVLFILVLLIEVRIPSNRPFARWRHFTNTVRILRYVQKCTRWRWRSKGFSKHGEQSPNCYQRWRRGPLKVAILDIASPLAIFHHFRRCLHFWTLVRILQGLLSCANEGFCLLNLLAISKCTHESKTKMDSGRSSSSSGKMTPSYKCSFAGRPFIQLRQTREILQKLSKVTFLVHCLLYYQHNVNLQNVLKMS